MASVGASAPPKAGTVVGDSPPVEGLPDLPPRMGRTRSRNAIIRLAGSSIAGIGLVIIWTPIYLNSTPLWEYLDKGRVFEQIQLVGYYFVPIGIMLFGAGWVLSRRALHSSGGLSPPVPRARQFIAAGLALTAAIILASGVLFTAVWMSYGLYSVYFMFEQWKWQIYYLTTGVGLILWGFADFLSQ